MVFNREIKQVLQKIVQPNRKDWSKLLEDSKTYEEKVNKFHDSRILRKEFHIGQKVLLFNSCLKLIFGKLRSRWDEPIVITNVFSHGAVEIKNEVTDKVFEVNGHQLKLFRENPRVKEEFVVNLSLVLLILCDEVP